MKKDRKSKNVERIVGFNEISCRNNIRKDTSYIETHNLGTILPRCRTNQDTNQTEHL